MALSGVVDAFDVVVPIVVVFMEDRVITLYLLAEVTIVAPLSILTLATSLWALQFGLTVLVRVVHRTSVPPLVTRSVLPA